MAASSDKLEYLTTQYGQKVKQVQESTKLYFQSIVVLGAGVAGAITTLATVDDIKGEVATSVFAGVPFFLIAWFGCYLFIYWEHHMMRVSLDHTEQAAAELVGIAPERTFLYHEDFLGVFNQADFPPWRRFPLRFKAVQWVFVIIALPGFSFFGYCAYRAFQQLPQGWRVIYLVAVLLMAVILVSITVQCVLRERRLKKHLGLQTKWHGEIA